jgi:TonB family protein
MFCLVRREQKRSFKAVAILGVVLTVGVLALQGVAPGQEPESDDILDDPVIKAELKASRYGDDTYLVTVRNAIGLRWNPVSRAGFETFPVVNFWIDPDGKILNPTLERSSGIFDIDHAAVKAVENTVRLPPPPGARRARPLRVHFTFGSRDTSAIGGGRMENYNNWAAKAFTGDGRSKNVNEAIGLYKQAAALGSAKAMVTLGDIYESGRDVPRDMIEALSWYRRAAQQGSLLACLALGRIYEAGDHVSKDPSEALSWYRKAARSTKEPVARQAREGIERLRPKQ